MSSDTPSHAGVASFLYRPRRCRARSFVLRSLAEGPDRDASCFGMTIGDLACPANRRQPGASGPQPRNCTPPMPPARSHPAEQPSVRWSPPVSRSSLWILTACAAGTCSSPHCPSPLHMPHASRPLPCRHTVGFPGGRGIRSWAVASMGGGLGWALLPRRRLLRHLVALAAQSGSEGLVMGGNDVLASVVRRGGGLGGMRCGGGRSRRGCRSGLC